MKKERKTLNMTASVIMNTSIALTLPLLEVSCEYLVIKPQQRQMSLPLAPSFISLNNRNKGQGGHNQSNLNLDNRSLVITRTNYYPISISVITQNKEVIKSNTVFLKNICSKITSQIDEGINQYKEFKFEAAYQLFEETKQNFDQLIKSQNFIFNQLKLFSENSFENFNSSNINMSSILNSENDNKEKVINFIYMIAMDINYLIEQARNKNMDSISHLLSIGESLCFFRSVIFGDDRFIDDNYEDINYGLINYNNNTILK